VAKGSPRITSLGASSPYPHECVEGDSLLKNPSPPLPSTLKVLKKPRHCSVLALMSKCLDAVLDYRPVLQRLYQQAGVFCELRLYGVLRSSAYQAPCPDVLPRPARLL
jgi:hypothetical protein